MAANIKRFGSLVFGARARITNHPADKVLAGDIIVVEGEKVIFGEFEDEGVEDEESFCDVVPEFAMEGAYCVPVRTDKRHGGTFHVFHAILVDFILPASVTKRRFGVVQSRASP
jgi:hypothetical protein